MGWVGKFEKYYGVLRRGGGGVNKIFGYYVVFEWSLISTLFALIYSKTFGFEYSNTYSI